MEGGGAVVKAAGDAAFRNSGGCALKTMARKQELPSLRPDKEVIVKRVALLFEPQATSSTPLEDAGYGPDGKRKVYTIDETLIEKGDCLMQCREYIGSNYPVICVTPTHLEKLPDKDNKQAVLTGNRVLKGKVINPSDVLSGSLRGSNFILLIDRDTFADLEMSRRDIHHVDLQSVCGEISATAPPTLR